MGSPCQSISYAIGQAVPNDKINIASGQYISPLIITKDGLELIGATPKPQIKRISGGINQALLVINGAKNVRVENLEFGLDQSFVAEGIIASGFVDGLSIMNNSFVQSRSTASVNSSYKWRNAISVNDSNGNSQSIAAAPGSSVSITGNTISGLFDPSNSAFLRIGVDMDSGVGTISGNTISAGVHDIRVRFSGTTGASSGTSTLIDSNILSGRGMELDVPNATAGSITISNNQMNAIAGTSGTAPYPADFSLLRLIANDQNMPVTISGNIFAGHQGNYRGAVVSSFPNTTFTNNTFTPAPGAADFASLVISNKALNTIPAAAPLQVSLTAKGNTFNGSGVAGAGRAVEFLNDNDAGGTATFGALIFGGTGPGETNSFDGNLRWYFRLDDHICETVNAPTCTFLDYAGAIGSNPSTNTKVRPFRGDVSATNNLFAGAAPSPATANAVLARTYDKMVNPALGKVEYGLTATRAVVYVDASYTGSGYGATKSFTSAAAACGTQTVYFGIDAFATLADGLSNVQSGGRVCVAKGNYPGSVTVATNPVEIIGDGNTASDTVIAGTVTLSVSGVSNAAPLLLQNLRVGGSASNGVNVANASHLAFVDVALSGNGNVGLNFNGTTDDVVISNGLFDGNTGAGIRTASTAQVSNVSIAGSTFSNNSAGIILFGAAGSGNGQVTNWTIDSSQFLSNANNDSNIFGAGIWLKTAGAGSVINGFEVTNSTFADNGSSKPFNQVGITVRARPNTTITGVRVCDNAFSETATPGTQITGINVYDDTSTGGTYQPIEVCGTNTMTNLQIGVSGLEQFNTNGTKPTVNITGAINVVGGGMRWNYINVTPIRSVVYVDDGFASNGNGDAVTFSHPQLNGGTPTPATFGDNAFATISAALERVESAGTVYVAAGIYAETSESGENLVVAKPVTILGEQANVDARTRNVGGSADASETIIVPAIVDPLLTLNSLGNSGVATIVADAVTLDGVIIDGDNPAMTSSVNLNGTNPDADSGAFIVGSNIAVQNTIFRNVGGIGAYAFMSSGAGGDNLLQYNRFTNITNPSTWGVGVYAGFNFYAQIKDNLFDQVRVGVQFAENDSLANPGVQPPTVERNEVHATAVGLFFNLVYGQASTWTIADNTIIASANAGQTGQWRGIQLETLQGAQTVVVTGNIVDGSALLGQRKTAGYVLNNWTSSLSSTTAVDGGTVSNVDVGVLATDATNYVGPVNGALIRNVAFDNLSIGAIYVEDTVEQTGSAAVTIGAGNTYSASVLHQLVLAGAAPGVNFSGSSVDDVLVRAAATNFWGLPNTTACSPTACTTTNASINAGIAGVAVAGTVHVEAGSFDESVIVDKSVTLYGPFQGIAGNDGLRSGSGEAAISPTTPTTNNGAAVKIRANDVTFDGFTISNVNNNGIVSGGNFGGASSNAMIINNRIVDVRAGSGIYTNGSYPAASGWTISRNLVRNVESAIGSGINYWAADGGAVSNNTIEQSGFAGIQIVGSSNVQVTGNSISDTARSGINVGVNTGGTADGNMVTGNTLSNVNTSGDSTAAGLKLSAGVSNVTFTCNAVSGSGSNGFATGTSSSGTPGARVFHNAFTATGDISHNQSAPIVIGSNWYGGDAPIVNGTNAAGAQVATALPATPIGNAACGDNSTVGALVATSGTPQTTNINTPFPAPLEARLVDQLGGAIAGATVTFAAPASGASAILGSPTGTTDFDGRVSISATANATVGSYSVVASSGSNTANFALTNASGMANVALTLNGPPSVVAGTATPGYTAQLSNTGSAIPENVLVNFVISRGAGLVAGDITLEYDTGGSNYAPIGLVACNTNQLCGSFGPPGVGFPVSAGYNATNLLRFTSNRSGAITLAASVDGVTTQTSYANSALTVTVSAQATTIAANGTTSFTGTVSQPVAGPLPSVLVTDDLGNPAANVIVTFAAGPDSGTLSGATQSTDSSGIATLGGWVLGPTAPTQTVTATAAGVTGSVLFTATASGDVTLTVTVDSGRQYVQAGSSISHLVAIGNSGSLPATGVMVTSVIPPELDSASLTWICVASAGSSCGGPTTGTGNLPTSIDIAAAGSVSFVITGTVLPGPTDFLTYAVSATRPTGTTGSNGNDTRTTTVVIFRNGFEEGGDGAQGIDGNGELIEMMLESNRLAILALPDSSVAAGQISTLASGAGGAFRIEGTWLNGQVWLRLVTRFDTAELSSGWKPVDRAVNQIGISYEPDLAGGPRLMLFIGAVEIDQPIQLLGALMLSAPAINVRSGG